MAVETNVDISMPDEYSSKYLRIQSKEIDRDLGSRKQICEFPINKQDEIRRVYFKKCPYQLKNINYPYSNDTHRHRFQPSNWPPHVQIPGYAPVARLPEKLDLSAFGNSQSHLYNKNKVMNV